MSPTFLRTVYQICGISFGGDESLHLEDDQRLAGLGVAADLVGVRHLLQRPSRSCRSPARPPAAPWRRARRRGTTIARKVNGGSSSWPSWKYAAAPSTHQHHHQVARQRRVLERPARDVERAAALGRGSADVARSARGAEWRACAATAGELGQPARGRPARGRRAAPRVGVELDLLARRSARARRRSPPVCPAQAGGDDRLVAFGAGDLDRLRTRPSSSPVEHPDRRCLPCCSVSAAAAP